ncbi:MAG: PD-(D/E)XK nuclease family protein [Thermoanaerobacteraceae bacterium]|nr:PD-(D/E)XK nuclease family protein [Thermoanaerobacteraceae bacterium]
MEDIKRMYFSQTTLKTYLSCPYRFKNRYIDGLYWRFDSPSAKEGSEFHLDMRRHFLGLPLSGKNMDLVSAAISFLPIEPGKEYLPEYTIRYNNGEMRLTVRYDLIIIGETVEIYDWKAEAARPNAEKLRDDIQTRLYLYTMAAAGKTIKEDIRPSDISITYFNPSYPSSPVRIDYDSYRFEKDEIKISGLVSQILKDTEFKPTDDRRKCAYCEYNRLCNGKPVSLDSIDDQDFELSWDDIEEISF